MSANGRSNVKRSEMSGDFCGTAVRAALMSDGKGDEAELSAAIHRKPVQAMTEGQKQGVHWPLCVSSSRHTTSYAGLEDAPQLIR